MNSAVCLPNGGGGSNWSAFKLKGEVGITRDPTCPRAPQIPAQRVRQHRAGLLSFHRQGAAGLCQAAPLQPLVPTCVQPRRPRPRPCQAGMEGPSATHSKGGHISAYGWSISSPPKPPRKTSRHSTRTQSPTASPSLPVTQQLIRHSPPRRLQASVGRHCPAPPSACGSCGPQERSPF